MNITDSHLLSATPCSILMALALKPQHGYGLMQQIGEDSPRYAKTGPGTLYTAIKKLREGGLIEEMPFAGSERRRYYRLTKRGWDQLAAELRRLEEIVRLGKERRVL